MQRFQLLAAVVAAWSMACLTVGAASFPITSGSLSEAEKSALNKNQYDAIDKTGSGTFTLEGIDSFAGKILVHEGTVEVNSKGLGTTACEITVDAGATLQINKEGQVPNTRKVTIAGTGVSSNGAVYANGNANCRFDNLNLSAAAKIATSATGSSGGINIYGTFNMNGYELTVQNDTMLNFGPTEINNPADIWIVGEDFLCPRATMPKSNGHKFIFTQTNTCGSNRQGVTLWQWKEGMDSDWGLDFRDSMFHAFQGGSANPLLKWSGDITIPDTGTKKFQTSDSSVLEFHGNISGAGIFYKENTACEFRFYGDNRNLGKISGSNGSFVFMNPESMPESFKTNGAYDPAEKCVVVLQAASEANEDGWTLGEITSFLSSLDNVHQCRMRIGVEAGDTFDYTSEFNPPATLKVNKFGVNGGGTLRITSAINTSESITYDSSTNGTVMFKDASASPSTRQGTMKGIKACQGDTVFENAGYIDIPKSSPNAYVYSTSKAHCSLTFGTNTTFGGKVIDNYCARTYVADSANSFGMMKIQPGAIVTNALHLGTGSNAVGVVYQTGGFFDCPNAATRNGYWGGCNYRGNSYGYYGLYGGEIVLHGYTGLGTMSGNVGIIDIRGGQFRQSGQYLQIGMAGTGVVYQTGGTYKHTDGNPLTICDASYKSDYTNGCGIYTLTGSNAVLSVKNAILLAGRTDGVGMLNVNDGAEVAFEYQIAKATTQNEKNVSSYVPLTGNSGYVNLNGGKLTYKIGWNGGEIFGVTEPEITNRGSPKVPDRVTIYEKGATFNVDNGYWANMRAPLKKPVGKQVVAIPLPGNLPKKYVGAPLVTICSQTGVGATAAADFDEITGTVTNITVTSGGWNYEDAHVIIQRGGADTCEFDLSAECFAAVQDGGMVKTGKNELKVFSQCDFTGPIDIRNGTVSLHDDASFASTVMRMSTNGTYLVCNGIVAFNATDFTGGGTISGTDLNISGHWHLTSDGCIDARGRLSIAADTAIDFAQGEEPWQKRAVIATSKEQIVLGSNITVPENYKLVLSEDSKQLLLRHLTGMVLIVR